MVSQGVVDSCLAKCVALGALNRERSSWSLERLSLELLNSGGLEVFPQSVEGVLECWDSRGMSPYGPPYTVCRHAPGRAAWGLCLPMSCCQGHLGFCSCLVCRSPVCSRLAQGTAWLKFQLPLLSRAGWIPSSLKGGLSCVLISFDSAD